MLPKSNTCADCPAPILKASLRCRACQTRRAQKAMILQKRIFEGRAMTGQEARARWVANNPEKARDGNIRAKARMKERIDKYKSERGCEDCYITDARVLDLHHRDGEDKVDHVNRMRCRASIAAVLQEAAKCDVLCANCHRIRHAEEDDQRRAADMQDISTPTGAPS